MGARTTVGRPDELQVSPLFADALVADFRRAGWCTGNFHDVRNAHVESNVAQLCAGIPETFIFSRELAARIGGLGAVQCGVEAKVAAERQGGGG